MYGFCINVLTRCYKCFIYHCISITENSLAATHKNKYMSRYEPCIVKAQHRLIATRWQITVEISSDEYGRDKAFGGGARLLCLKGMKEE